MNVKINYSELSKEELISLLKDQEEAHLRKVEELSKNNQELIHENERLASEKKDLEEQVKRWKAKYEYELAKEKKGNLERIVTKSDNAFRTVEERRV